MLLFFHIISCTSEKKAENITDSVSGVAEYSDINIMIAVQLILINKDSKTFVDRPTKYPFPEVLGNFQKIEKQLGLDRYQGKDPEKIRETFYRNLKMAYSFGKKHRNNVDELSEEEKRLIQLLKEFVVENYHEKFADLEEAVLNDYNDTPKYLTDVKDKDMREIIKALHNKWGLLSKKSKGHLLKRTTTYIPSPYFFIVPGGRFKEIYYWDSFWILIGLEVSQMHETALNILKNISFLIQTNGFMLNGTRKYYTKRSQPPFFTIMLHRLYNIDKKKFSEFVLGENGLAVAEQEHAWLMKNRTVGVFDKDGNEWQLNRYYVETDYPRPESFYEDTRDAFESSKESIKSASKLFSHIKSAAESGWDFSTRWLTNPEDVSTISTSSIIPADLNAILYKVERCLGELYSEKGNREKSEQYFNMAYIREKAINAILWNNDAQVWCDYNMAKEKHVTHRFYFSNIMPMIYGIKPVKGNFFDILLKYNLPLFGYPGGIPASSDGIGKETNLQWDFPNVWPPHQHLLAEFLLENGQVECALHIGKSFYGAISTFYKKRQDFPEKFNCEVVGQVGTGGEYFAPLGFGWTNGSTLWFIKKFRDKLAEKHDHATSFSKVKEIILNNCTKKKLLKVSERIDNIPIDNSLKIEIDDPRTTAEIK